MVEDYFIGQIILDPKIAFQSKVKDEEFSSPFCKTLYISIKSMLRKGETVDLPSLCAVNPDLSVSQIAALTNKVNTTKNWQTYEREIKESARKMKIQQICENIYRTSNMSSDDMAAKMMKALETYTSFDDYQVTENKKSLNETIDEIEKAYLAKGQILGIPSGFSKMDQKLNGFQKRRLYIIGARPSQGKTALLMNFVFHAQEPVGIISAESSRTELDKRLISFDSGISGEKLNTGILSNQDFKHIISSRDNLDRKKYYYFDKPNIRIDELLLKAREMKNRFNIKALYVDYLQQIQSTRSEKRNEQVADVSTKLKALARDLQIPVISAAQLRRDASGRRPELSDLGDSGQIERDADCVILIHHGNLSVKNGSQERLEKKKGSYLLIEKNRDGATGAVEVVFKKECYTFSEINP